MDLQNKKNALLKDKNLLFMGPLKYTSFFKVGKKQLVYFSGPIFGSTKVHKFFGSTEVHESQVFEFSKVHKAIKYVQQSSTVYFGTPCSMVQKLSLGSV